MTLIVYKNGELAADNGCTRNDSREPSNKIRILRDGDCTITIGYSGNLDAIERQLVQDFKYNPNLVVYIRADEMGFNKDLYAIIDRCQRNGITRYSLRTQPR